MKILLSICKKEAVFCLALLAVCAVLPFALPAAEDVNFKVIALLFSLMLITAALETTGALERLAALLLARFTTERGIALALVGITAVLSMFVTNDVALITMVPFTLLLAKRMRRAPFKTVVLETAAANLGSAVLPFGNPQNLYLYDAYAPGLSGFFSAVLPAALVGLALVLAVTAVCSTGERIQARMTAAPVTHRAALLAYLPAFVLVTLSVLGLIDAVAALAFTAAVTLLFLPKNFAKADYFLLTTFLLFFLFVSSLSHIPAVSALFGRLIADDLSVLTGGVLLSQFVSNVPAAILLSSFTTRFGPLIAGVTIGGLGTPIASLASLISLKLYAAEHRAGPYLAYFSATNVVLLLILYLPYAAAFC